MDTDIDRALREFTQHRGIATPKMTHFALFAEFLAVVAEKNAETAHRMEQQTDRLVGFTRGLYWFTGALIFIGLVQVAMVFLCP